MKRKKIVCGIISLALVSAIAPYSKISSSLPTEASVVSTEHTITKAYAVADVLINNIDVWNTMDYNQVTFLDLDFDGELELLVLNNQQNTMVTSIEAYKIDIQNNAIVKMDNEIYTEDDVSYSIDFFTTDRLKLYHADQDYYIPAGGILVDIYDQGNNLYIGTDHTYFNIENRDKDVVQVMLMADSQSFSQYPLFETKTTDGVVTNIAFIPLQDENGVFDGDTSEFYSGLTDLNLQYTISYANRNVGRDTLIEAYNGFSYDGYTSDGNDIVDYNWCGDNAKWSFDDTTGALTISGTGELYQYKNFEVPWVGYDIKSVTIEEGITNVCDYAFCSKGHLTEVNLPNSITTIGHDAFANCTSLTKLNLPINVTTIGSSAFYGCSSLCDITLPTQVTSIGEDAFNRCYSLTNIVLPKSLTAIQKSTFANCNALTDITIGDSVVLIDDNAFESCTSLQSITIPEKVATMGMSVFYNCSKLNSITVSPNNKNLCSVDGVLFNYDKTTLIKYPMGKTESVYTIPDTVVSIESGAFSQCSSLTDIQIPDSVKLIQYGAFYGTTYLDTIIANSTDYVILGNGILYSYVGEDTNLVVPDGVVSICKYVFDNNVVSVTLPNSLEYITDGAFLDYNSALKDIYYNGTTTEWNAIKKNNRLIPNSATIHCNDGIATNLIGDINCDGKVSVKDLVMLKKYLLGVSEVGGDVNGDGKITVLDLMFLKRILLQS